MNDMTPGLGHNMPPGPMIPEALAAKVADFTDAAGAWLDLKALETREQSEKATDFINGARAVWNELEAERKSQKKPHDDAAKAVQELFSLPLGKVKIAEERVKTLQTKYLQAEREREEAERKLAEAQARREAEEAERKLAEAEARNDVSGMAEAEAAIKAASKEIKAASKEVSAQAGSATGAGRKIALRKTYSCTIEARGPALAHYREHPEVLALLERLATAEVRAMEGDKIAPPGFKLIVEEKAA